MRNGVLIPPFFIEYFSTRALVVPINDLHGPITIYNAPIPKPSPSTAQLLRSNVYLGLLPFFCSMPFTIWLKILMICFGKFQLCEISRHFIWLFYQNYVDIKYEISAEIFWKHKALSCARFKQMNQITWRIINQSV